MSAMETHRADYVAGLRQLADLLEAHEELPLPYDGNSGAMSFMFLSGEDPRAAMADAVRALPVPLSKNDPAKNDYADSYFELSGRLHGLKIKLTAWRAQVCERVVVDTREVTEEVPDPEALAEVPKVKQRRTVETIEWRCNPVLAAANDGGDRDAD